MSIGITGHQRLKDESLWPSIETQLREAIERFSAPGDVALSALAVGADQRFARIALDCGRNLHAVIPCAHYETTFANDSERRAYEELLARATDVTRLDFPQPTEEAFEAGGHEIVARADTMIAVWDGEAAAGRGGTGDIVAYARERGVRVRVVGVDL
jgi:hypothetical protein